MSAPPLASALPVHDAIVLAGGRASRLGGDKPNVHVAGRRLLDHVLAATTSARRVVVVGPDDLLPGSDTGAGARVVLAREDPPFGGPVAGLAAGLARLAEPQGHDEDPAHDSAPVLLLACDVPLAPGLVPGLLAAWATARAARPGGGPDDATPIDGICVEADGRAQWLLGVYDPVVLRRGLVAVAAERGIDGASMKQLVGHLTLSTIQDPQGLSTDVDTWHDVERIDSRLAEGDPR